MGVVEGALVVGRSEVGVGEATMTAAVGPEAGVPVVEFSGLRTAKRIAATTVRATTINVPTAMSRRWTGEEAALLLEGSGKDTGFYLPAKMSPMNRNSGQAEGYLLPTRGR